MKRHNKFITVFCLIALLITVLATDAYAVSGATVLNSESFDKGLGVTNAQNAGGHGQSKAEVRSGADGGKYGAFYPTLTGTNPGHSFLEINYTDVYLGVNDDVRYFILEFDVATESQYVSSMEFEFIGKNTEGKSVFGKTKPSITESASGEWTLNAGGTLKMEQERGAWQHLTFIVDVVRNDAAGSGSVNSVLYTYHNGSFVGSGQLLKNDAVYLHSLRISYPNGKSVDATDVFCIDNLKVTKLSDAYDGNLATVLADSSKSLKEFDLATFKDGYVFPKTAAIAAIGDKRYSTVSELEAAITAGDEITLLANIYDKIEIPCECSIYNPNGYSFTYDAGSLEKAETDSTVAFLEPFDSVEVIWHIGDKTEKQTYTERIVPTPPAYEQTTEIGGVLWKAIGFSKSEGGDVVSDLGFVSPYNKEFWLVYAEPIAYSLHKDRTITYAYGVSEAEALISDARSGDTVYLLADIATAASFTVSSKTLTVDLGTHTLRMAEGGVGDMFRVGASASLTVKNGRIEALLNGRIPAGGTSVVRRRVFATVADSATLLASGLVLDASKMLAVINGGGATFDGCVIDFTNDYDNMIDLYANNSAEAPTTLNFKNCDIKAYKTVVNVFKPSSVSKNNAVIYAENCSIKTNERVFAVEASELVDIKGGKYDCKYLFGKLNTNKAAVARISEGTLLNFEVLDEKGGLKIDLGDAAIARINDATGYKYTVAKSYAKIGWVWPSKTVNEVWRVGDMPICPMQLPESTREVRYEIPEIVPVESAKTYTLKTSQNFDTKVSAELGMSYSLNFYMSEISFKSVKIGKETYTREDAKIVEIDGKTYYKFNTGAITAVNSPDALAVTVTVPSAFGDKQYRYEIGLLDYLDKILSGGYSYSTYRLALSVLGCIKAQLPENYSNVKYNRVIKKYNTDAVLSEIESTGSDISAIASAVSKAYVTKENGIAYRLDIAPTFSGEIKVSYTLGGTERTDSFVVSGGKYGSVSYIEIHTDAAEFASGIRVSVADAVATVDISLCRSNTEHITADELAAIYAYSREVKKYVDESKEG